MSLTVDASKPNDIAAVGRLRFEHDLYAVMRAHNERALKSARHAQDPGRGTVSLSRMRRVHDEAIESMIDDLGYEHTGRDRRRIFDNDNIAGLLLDRVERILYEQGDIDEPLDREVFMAANTEFNSGIGSGAGVFRTGRVPISPYDGYFADRAAVLRAGGHECYIDIAETPEGASISDLTRIGPASQAMLVHRPGEKERKGGQGYLVGIADMSGLSQLAPFMDPDDFSAAATRSADAWAPYCEGEAWQGTEAGNMRRAAGQMRSVLDRLAREGHDVRCVPDGGGTVTAIVDGVSVRAFELPGQARFVGRSYASGAVWRLADVREPTEADDEATKKWLNDSRARLEAEVTEDTREAQVRLALGESPDVGGRVSFASSGSALRIINPDRVGDIYCSWTPDARTADFDPDDPLATVAEMVADARAHFTAEVNLDGIRAAAAAHDESIPDTADQDVAMMRRAAFGWLRETPDAPVDEMIETWLDANMGTADSVRTGVPAEGAEGTLDPARVARFANGQGEGANRRRILAALAHEDELASEGAAGHRRVPASELMGGNAYADSAAMARFDDATAMGYAASGPFTRRVMDAVTGSLEGTGLTVTGIEADASGILRWRATKPVSGTDVPMTGVIGPVFEPSDTGEVRVDVRGTDPFYVEPAYTAVVTPPRLYAEAPATSVYRRMVLTHDLDRVVTEAARRVRRDVMSVSGADSSRPGTSHVGSAASLSGVWRNMAGTRIREDAMLARVDGGEGRHITAEADEARLATERGRVHMDKRLHNASSSLNIINKVECENPDVEGLTDDVCGPEGLRDVVLTGLTDMSSMSNRQLIGAFDQSLTAQGRDQGVNKTLVSGASVVNGRIVFSDDPDDRAPVMYDEIFAYAAYDNWLRRNMAAHNYQAALEVTEPVQVAHVSLGGFEQDDAIVISSEFAERYAIRDPKTGERRPLKVNDKISDAHGNKGLVSLVIDRDMTEEEARSRGVYDQWRTFRDNPGLSCVMGPFSFISRGNAGTGREGMASPHDLVLRDADGNPRTVEAGSCDLHMIVQPHTVDEKSSVYTEAGEGRKIGWQLSAGLAALGADELMHEVFASNEAGLSNVRETVRVLGFDVARDGTLGHLGDFEDDRPAIPPVETAGSEAYIKSNGGIAYGRPMVNKRGTHVHSRFLTVREEADLRRNLSREGGMLPLAMPLSFPGVGNSPERRPFPTDAAGRSLMPVMALTSRSSGGFSDGDTYRSWDHTERYARIMANDARYRMCMEAAKKADGNDALKFIAEADSLAEESQALYDAIAADVEAGSIKSHDNVFKNEALSSRIPNSATLPWSPDPRLDIDRLSIGVEEAKRLGIHEGDPVVLWRDPVLTSKCVRGFSAHISGGIGGLQVNPVVAGVIGGDFDGDTVGIYVPQTEAGKAAAIEKMGFAKNILDTAHGTGTDGMYDFDLGMGLDIALAKSKGHEINSRFNEVRAAANVGDPDALAMLNDFVHGAQAASVGEACIRYGNPEDHVRSIYEACVETKVKGSENKLVDEYCHNLGVEVDGGRLTDGGVWRDGCVRDLGHPVLTAEDDVRTQCATDAKAEFTGLSGSMQQAMLMQGVSTEFTDAGCTIAAGPYQATLDWKTYDRLVHQQAPVLFSLSETLRGQPLDGPRFITDPVNNVERPVFDHAKGNMTPDKFKAQITAILKAMDLKDADLPDDALEVISHAGLWCDRKYMNDHIGGSPAHVLAFISSDKRMAALEAKASAHENLYTGPVAGLTAPESVREAGRKTGYARTMSAPGDPKRPVRVMRLATVHEDLIGTVSDRTHDEIPS